MRGSLCAFLAVLAVTPLHAAIDLDVTAEDIERVLAIARMRDKERAPFHAPYIVKVDAPFVESVEVVTELRRVVLLAEERIRKGDHGFGYSVTQARHAIAPWKQRVAFVARMRFHPQNNYVDVPNVEITLAGADGKPMGVLKQPILSLPTGTPAAAGDRLPVLGAMVEAVFDATTVGQTIREVIVWLEGKEVARTKIDLGKLD